MLKSILGLKAIEVEKAKSDKPLSQIERELTRGNNRFSSAVSRVDWALIAECKTASPSKGILCSRYEPADLASIYTSSGAAALSVLTDSQFAGRLDDITMVKQTSNLPILRKDFIIDLYQIYQARLYQADAVLLIAAILSELQLAEYVKTARELGMDCIVEVHSLQELRRVQNTDVPIIGINNRDLTTFTVKPETTLKLLPFCDNQRSIISESGIRDRADARRLKEVGVRGILVGEGLVCADDIGAKTKELSLQ